MELASLLEKMKMDHLLMQLDALCEQASKKDLGYREFLSEALGTEWRGRHGKAVEARLKMARFPYLKTLEQFDFTFQPSIDRKVIRELAGLSFVERSENVILLGPPGVGKTHLAIALGIKAVEAGFRVHFLSLESLLTRLTRARMENRVERQLQQFAYARVLIIDEMGYLPMSRDEAGLFFRLLTRRYERATLIITSNKSFVDWGEIFNDQVLATAILGGVFLEEAVAVIITLVLLSSVSSLVMAGPRVCAKMASDGYLPKRLAAKDGPPRVAIALQSTLALLLLWTSSFEALLTYIGFTLSVSTAVTVVALLVLRSREGSGLRIPGYPVVPWLFLLGVVAITVFTMTQRPLDFLVGFGTIAAGLIAWSFNRKTIATRSSAVTKARIAP